MSDPLWHQRMTSVFDPGYTPQTRPTEAGRVAAAAEYSAYQLGEINRKLDSLIAALERIASRP